MGTPATRSTSEVIAAVVAAAWAGLWPAVAEAASPCATPPATTEVSAEKMSLAPPKTLTSAFPSTVGVAAR